MARLQAWEIRNIVKPAVGYAIGTTLGVAFTSVGILAGFALGGPVGAWIGLGVGVAAFWAFSRYIARPAFNWAFRQLDRGLKAV